MDIQSINRSIETQKSALLQHSLYEKVETVEGVFRKIPSDLKDIIGEERFKREYEDVIDVATGEKIKILLVDRKKPK